MSHDEDSDDDEMELKRLLGVVSDKGLKTLDVVELERLRVLLQAKDYGDNKKANKSKAAQADQFRVLRPAQAAAISVA
ncbi:MAG: hypothetical protein QXX64_06680 [Nitrososphaera sp.]